MLNESLYNPVEAVTDETISAVLLLTHIVVSALHVHMFVYSYEANHSNQSIIGEPEEVETHLSGLKQMIRLRGQTFSIAGVFLHMLCTSVSHHALSQQQTNKRQMQPPHSRHLRITLPHNRLLHLHLPQIKPFFLSPPHLKVAAQKFRSILRLPCYDGGCSMGIGLFV